MDRESGAGEGGSNCYGRLGIPYHLVVNVDCFEGSVALGCARWRTNGSNIPGFLSRINISTAGHWDWFGFA